MYYGMVAIVQCSEIDQWVVLGTVTVEVSDFCTAKIGVLGVLAKSWDAWLTTKSGHTKRRPVAGSQVIPEPLFSLK